METSHVIYDLIGFRAGSCWLRELDFGKSIPRSQETHTQVLRIQNKSVELNTKPGFCLGDMLLLQYIIWQGLLLSWAQVSSVPSFSFLI